MKSSRSLAHHFAAWVSLICGLFACMAAAIWLGPYLDFGKSSYTVRDPLFFPYLFVVVLFWRPSLICLRRLRAMAADGLARIMFTACGTTGLLGVMWFYVWLAITDLFGSARTQSFMAPMFDLVDLQSRYNAGVSLAMGTVFWIVSFSIASWQHPRSP